MAPRTVVQRKDNISKLLRDDNVKKIILVGDSGVGKTWTARQVSNHAVKNGLFEIAVWVFLNRENDVPTLCKSIAHQLSLHPISEEWEAEDGKEGEAKKENHEDLQMMIADALVGKRFLLILDDEGDKMDEEQIISKLKTLFNLHDQSSYKVIITKAKKNTPYATSGTEGVILVEPLSVEESLSLWRERVGRSVYEDLAIEALAKTFIEKTKYLPSAIILMAKAFSYFVQHDSGTRILERYLNEASASDKESYNITQLVRSGYDLLPRNVLIDCCRRGSHFFRDRGSIHYNELIAYWVMEGYFGHVDCIEKAHEKGHSVFMELVDCQVLKKLEGGFVIMDSAIIDLDDSDRYGFGGTASLGLADLSEDVDWEGFGRITQKDGMIKSLCTGKKDQKLSTLFLNGNRCGEIKDNFFGSKKELQVLALFNPTLKSLTQLLSDMHKLRVLVLRGCHFLEKINEKFELQRLTVLEISNASSLEKIPDDFFDHMLQLQSLHISELKVDHLPSSLEKLKELRWLILRDCSCFKTLISLNSFSKLLVCDVSGAKSLTTFRDKAFKDIPKLQTLDLSRTSIKRLPKLIKLGDLTHFSLSGCKSLDRLPRTESLTTLQTLDLSGARNFKEFHEQSLGNSGGLKILDLSETPLEKVPSKINPRHLFLKHCSQLKKLPCLEALKDLEVLDDVSGSKSLVEIEDQFFSRLRSLQILNLSETSIKTLPSLANQNNIRQLLLSGCIALKVIEDKSFEHMSFLQHLDFSETSLEYLPSLLNLSNLSVLSLKNCTNLIAIPLLESLTNLEELNLCGISTLTKNGAGFLEHRSHLRILDLSETQLEELPSMSNLKKLRQLSLRGCQGLQKVLNLEELTRLEVLDLSRTAVTRLPPLHNFSNLKQLLLGGCSKLEGFLDVEMHDLLGPTAKELPYGISKLTHLECLDLPNMKTIEEAESKNTKSLPEEDWGIASFLDETHRDNGKPPISVNGIQFLQVLKKNPSLLTRFHFCVHPSTKGQNKNGDTYSYGNDLIFRDTHFQTVEFGRFKDQRALEINGFNRFPKGAEDILCSVDCVFFINNTFNKWLSDIGVSTLKAIKGCWIERCTEMEGVFHAGKEEDIAKLGETLEILGVSNAINLYSVHSGDLLWQGLENLKSLYLDCCPKLSTVFSSSQLPKNLKVLQVKFCDKLESVFEQTSPEPKLPKLETLCLWELPELKSIGCTLPSLQTLKVWECPKLQNSEINVSLVESLQTLWISNVVDLKSVYSGSQQRESLRNLVTLVLQSCPMLDNVLSSPQPPQSLKTLKIKSCNKLKTVFEHDTSSDYVLQKLETLDLQELPKLEKIGGKFPSVEKPIIMGCPKCR